jgi:hypothetical protein
VKLFALSSPSVRVLMGIAMRSSSHGTPIRSWYRPIAPATPVTNTSFTLPPSFSLVAFALESGVWNDSKRFASDRGRSRSERAGSVTSSCRRTEPANPTRFATPRRADSGLASVRIAASSPCRAR